MRVETRAGNNGLWADMNKSSHRSNPFRRQPQTRTAAILRLSDTTNHHFLEINYYFVWKVKKHREREKKQCSSNGIPWMESTEIATQVLVCERSSVEIKHFHWDLWWAAGYLYIHLISHLRRRMKAARRQRFREEESDANSTGASHPNSFNKLFTECDSESEYRSVSIVPPSSDWFHLQCDKLEVLKIGTPGVTLAIWFTFSSAGVDGFFLSPARQAARQPHTRSKGRDCYGKRRLKGKECQVTRELTRGNSSAERSATCRRGRSRIYRVYKLNLNLDVPGCFSLYYVVYLQIWCVVWF